MRPSWGGEEGPSFLGFLWPGLEKEALALCPSLQRTSKLSYKDLPRPSPRLPTSQDQLSGVCRPGGSREGRVGARRCFGQPAGECGGRCQLLGQRL